MQIKRPWFACLAVVFAFLSAYGAEQTLDRKRSAGAPTSDLPVDSSAERGLVGYWKLKGDCRDYSGQGNHGVNHGVDFDSAAFDGISAYVEVPSSASLKFGT